MTKEQITANIDEFIRLCGTNKGDELKYLMIHTQLVDILSDVELYELYVQCGLLSDERTIQ